MTQCTYDGRFRAVTVTLPDRRVPVARGQAVTFTNDELEHLDPNDWVELRRTATDGPPTAAVVVTGTIAAVLAAADGDPAAATELLAAELATAKPRSTLVAQLAAIADTNPIPADQATTQED